MTDALKNPFAGQLVEAIKDVDVARVKALLDLGADPNERDEKGDPCLRHAVTKESYELVELLLDKGADVDGIGSYGHTALIHAVFGEDPEIVRLLLERGAGAANNDAARHAAIGFARAICYFVDMSDMIPLLLKGPELRRAYAERIIAEKVAAAQRKRDKAHNAAAATQDTLRSKRPRSIIKPRPAL